MPKKKPLKLDLHAIVHLAGSRTKRRARVVEVTYDWQRRPTMLGLRYRGERHAVFVRPERVVVVKAGK